MTLNLSAPPAGLRGKAELVFLSKQPGHFILCDRDTASAAYRLARWYGLPLAYIQISSGQFQLILGGCA